MIDSVGPQTQEAILDPQHNSTYFLSLQYYMMKAVALLVGICSLRKVTAGPMGLRGQEDKEDSREAVNWDRDQDKDEEYAASWKTGQYKDRDWTPLWEEGMYKDEDPTPLWEKGMYKDRDWAPRWGEDKASSSAKPQKTERAGAKQRQTLRRAQSIGKR